MKLFLCYNFYYKIILGVKIIKSEDIAKILGVSRSTVSRVLNNYPDISESTRQKFYRPLRNITILITLRGGWLELKVKHLHICN